MPSNSIQEDMKLRKRFLYLIRVSEVTIKCGIHRWIAVSGLIAQKNILFIGTIV